MRWFFRFAGRTSGALLFLSVLSTCASSNYVHLYATQPFAPSYTAADIAAMNHMGATIVDSGINFCVYSEHATKMQVLLFNNATDPLPSQQFDMTAQGPVWSVFISGVGLHQIYGYVAWGPNWPYDPAWQPGTITGFQADVDAAGNRFNPNKLLFDPWARMATGPFNWSAASAASGPDRTVSTYQAAGKAITVQSAYQWSSNESQWLTARQNPNMPGHRWQDQIVYETHPKGFTASPASGVTYPGTFRGIGENVAYLKDLGITAVELMPSFWKSTDGGYWGYDTIGFFIPELTYTALLDPNNPEAPIDEFKWMVDQLHQAGIEVYLDVVYNHTGEGGLWQSEIQLDDVPPLAENSLINFDAKEVASLLEWRGLDNQAFYGLSADNQTYWDNSGVGQDTRCNHVAFQRLILDSLHYWVDEMHVDGFRFDEAAVLGEVDMNYNSFKAAGSVLQLIADDSDLQQKNIRIVAEPWSGGGDYNGSFPASTTESGYGWAEWNGPYRDWWRSMMNLDDWTFGSKIWNPVDANDYATGGDMIFGSEYMFGPSGRPPYDSYNFITIHDGMTMYDLLTYPGPQDGCGPLNPICCTDPESYYCVMPTGTDNNISRNWGEGHEDVKREIMRGLFAALLTSRGTPLLLGGDEWARTQLGNNNAYSTLADNSSNWYDWGSWEPNDEKQRMHDFVRQMIAIRKEFGYALAPATYDGGVPLSWEDNTAGQPPNWNSRHLAVHYPPSDAGPEFEILYNLENGLPSNGPMSCSNGCPGDQTCSSSLPAASPTGYDNACVCNSDGDCPWGESCVSNVCELTFTLPAGHWARLVDTQSYFDEDGYFTGSANAQQSANASLQTPVSVPGNTYQMMPRSVVILENTSTMTTP